DAYYIAPPKVKLTPAEYRRLFWLLWSFVTGFRSLVSKYSNWTGRKETCLLILSSRPPQAVIAKAVCCLTARRKSPVGTTRPSGVSTVMFTAVLVVPYTPPNNVWT